MKKIIIPILLALFFISCSSFLKRGIDSQKGPEWFKKLKTKDYTIIGKGSGTSYSEARAYAFSDISSQTAVRVNEEIKIIKKKEKGSITSFAKQQIRLNSSKKISDAVLINKEFYKNRFYVAFQTDFRPKYVILAEKIKKTFLKNNIPKPKSLKFSGSRYIKSSYFSKRIKDIFKDFDGIGEKEISLFLERRSGSWFLNAGSDSVRIKDIFMAVDFSFLKRSTLNLYLINGKNRIIPNRLKKGDKFRLLVKSIKKEGYISIFNLYSDGRVALLGENIKINSGITLFPASKKQIFEAALIEKNRVVLDYYIAVISDEILDLVAFKTLKESSIIEGEHSYSLQKLLNFLDNKKPENISAITVETIP